MFKRGKADGVFFEKGVDYWEVVGVGDPLTMLVAATELLGESCTLYVENPRSSAVSDYLQVHQVADPGEVAAGTLWPRPVAYHIEMTSESVAGLAAVARDLAWPEICDHLVAYRGDTAILLWYDFPEGAVYLHREIPGVEVSALCDGLSADYRLTRP